MSEKPSKLSKVAAIGTVTALLGAGALAAHESRDNQPARVEAVSTNTTLKPEVTSTTVAEKPKPADKKIAKVPVSTTTTIVTTTTQSHQSHTPETAITTEVQSKPWELVAYQMSHPEVGQDIQWLSTDIIVKPGAKLFSAPSNQADSLQPTDSKDQYVANPEYWLGDEGPFVCWLDKSSLMCSNDFKEMTAMVNGKEIPFDPASSALGGAKIAYVDVYGPYVNNSNDNRDLSEHGTRIGQRVDGFTNVL